MLRLVKLVGLGKKNTGHFSRKTANWQLKGPEGRFDDAVAVIRRVKRLHRLLGKRAECKVIIWK